MNTRPQEVLSYRDLARQNARIHRQVELDALPRVAALMAADTDVPLDVTVSFTREQDGLVIASGDIVGRLPLTCSRCAEALEHSLAIEFRYALVATEAEATELEATERGGDQEIVVASGAEVTLAELIEDEILLGLPEWLCIVEPCDNQPLLSFPAEGGAREPDPGRENPFAALAELKAAEAPSESVTSSTGDEGADRVDLNE
jgi:uncharacterized protein